MVETAEPELLEELQAERRIGPLLVAPAESDIQRYFKVTAPAAHQMITTLEKRGLIEKIPGQARTIRILLPRENLPDLD